MKATKTQKIIGVSALGLIAYYMYNQGFLGGFESSSGSFGSTGGGESATLGEGELSGTTDSGMTYNINLPEVDTSSLISALSSQGALTTAKKDAETVSIPDVSEWGAPKYGTEEMIEQGIVNTGSTGTSLKKKTVDNTGYYNISKLSQVVQGADLGATKKETTASTGSSNIFQGTASSISEIADASSWNLPTKSSSKTSSSSGSSGTATTKKAKKTYYKEMGQTKYKDASGSVHVVAKR